MKIGYVPYSADLTHPADRRRIKIWSAALKRPLETKDFSQVDILVLSSRANYGKFIKNSNSFIILDLVDGYIGENPPPIKDFLRNILRTWGGSSSFRWLTYTRHLTYACKNADRIIVASPEQRLEVLKYCDDVHVILDDHSELDVSLHQNIGREQKDSLFWEGLPYTFKHFSIASSQIDQFLSDVGGTLEILSKNIFRRWGGIAGRQTLTQNVYKLFPKSKNSVNVHEWEIEKLIELAKECDIGIIPINVEDKFALLKPENKLLSMWILGLPTLVSRTPAYERVLLKAGLGFCLVSDEDWYEKIQFLRNNDRFRKEILEKANRYLSENHSRDILVEKWSDALTVSGQR
jgi:glycosyltransferase involved in cell wall biosynthesis